MSFVLTMCECQVLFLGGVPTDLAKQDLEQTVQ